MLTDLLTILLIGSTAAFLIEMIFLRIGVSRGDSFQPNREFEPTVSVIVAARNEERFIAECIRSLARLDYPKDRLEIIIVNDRSTDRTGEIIAGEISAYPFMRVVTTSAEQGNLRGKTNAVARGVDCSTGEILLFTDADCTVQAGWVRATVDAFDNSTGIVGGFTVLKAGRAFEGMQALDWFILFGVSSAAAGWGIPLTAIGNNLAVRRRAYDETGGYEKIPFSVTEDYSLVQAILQRTRYSIRFPLNRSALVESHPCENWEHLFRQKQRWGVGGLDMVFRGFALMSVGWIVKALIIVSVFFVPSQLWISCAAVKILSDIIFLEKIATRFEKWSYFRYLPVFELYYTLYVVFIPFLASFSRKVVWKERSL